VVEREVESFIDDDDDDDDDDGSMGRKADHVYQ